MKKNRPTHSTSIEESRWLCVRALCNQLRIEFEAELLAAEGPIQGPIVSLSAYRQTSTAWRGLMMAIFVGEAADWAMTACEDGERFNSTAFVTCLASQPGIDFDFSVWEGSPAVFEAALQLTILALGRGNAQAFKRLISELQELRPANHHQGGAR